MKPCNQINSIRERLGYSLTELAARSQVSLAMLSRIAKWNVPTSRKTAARIARALRCAVEDLRARVV